MTNPSLILALKDVLFRWPGRDAFEVSIPQFQVKAGEKVLLLGESGSGKSTLLSLICGTLAAQSGIIEVAGRDLSTLTAGQRDRFRSEQIGLIFQQFNLLPFANVRDNILLPLRFAPNRKARVAAPQTEAARLCGALGLPENVMTTQAANLSVGQQQRVAAARALIGQPALIIADEPTSALDASTQSTFLELLFAQTRDSNSSLLMVSHDARLAPQFDRVVQMSEIAQTHRALA